MGEKHVLGVFAPVFLDDDLVTGLQSLRPNEKMPVRFFGSTASAVVGFRFHPCRSSISHQPERPASSGEERELIPQYEQVALPSLFRRDFFRIYDRGFQLDLSSMTIRRSAWAMIFLTIRSLATGVFWLAVDIIGFRPLSNMILSRS